MGVNYGKINCGIAYDKKKEKYNKSVNKIDLSIDRKLKNISFFHSFL